MKKEINAKNIEFVAGQQPTDRPVVEPHQTQSEDEERDVVYAGLEKCVDELISLANNLDELGHSNETNIIDLLIEQLVGEGRE
tara:strand:- start:2930 stop:3178 length:249 start_codon:yes stop_codon:yes gene_type:complete